MKSRESGVLKHKICSPNNLITIKHKSTFIESCESKIKKKICYRHVK